MGKTRISRATKKFAIYINRTNGFLQIVIDPTNGTRLGLTTQNVTDWNSKTIAALITYGKWGDPLQKGPAVNKAMKLAIKNFITFAQPLLDIIAASPNLTSDDELMFNVVGSSNRANPTHRTDPIEAAIYTKLVQVGGGRMRAKGYTTTTARRAGLPPDTGADSVKRYWALSTTAINGPATYRTAGVVSEVETGASTIMEFGADNIGQYLNYWDQWYDTKNPKRGGPISERQVKLIS